MNAVEERQLFSEQVAYYGARASVSPADRRAKRGKTINADIRASESPGPEKLANLEADLMFTRDGIKRLHEWTHQSLDILLEHVSSVPAERLWETLAGFGFPTVWEQLVHILEVEEGWVCDLQDNAQARWREEHCGTMDALLASKERVRNATREYLDSLSEIELNSRLTERPKEWVGELKSPAFILLHVVTHTFHHKGQVVAMLRTLGYPAPDTDLQRS